MRKRSAQSTVRETVHSSVTRRIGGRRSRSTHTHGGRCAVRAARCVRLNQARGSDITRYTLPRFAILLSLPAPLSWARCQRWGDRSLLPHPFAPRSVSPPRCIKYDCPSQRAHSLGRTARRDVRSRPHRRTRPRPHLLQPSHRTHHPRHAACRCQSRQPNQHQAMQGHQSRTRHQQSSPSAAAGRLPYCCRIRCRRVLTHSRPWPRLHKYHSVHSYSSVGAPA